MELTGQRFGPPGGDGEKGVVDRLTEVGHEDGSQTGFRLGQMDTVLSEVEPTVVVELEGHLGTLCRRPAAQCLQAGVDLDVAGRSGKPRFELRPNGGMVGDVLDEPQARDAELEEPSGAFSVTGPLEHGHSVVRAEIGDQLSLFRLGMLRTEPHPARANTGDTVRVGFRTDPLRPFTLLVRRSVRGPPVTLVDRFGMYR
jgi:hypothetical protein